MRAFNKNVKDEGMEKLDVYYMESSNGHEETEFI
jgi:hypothetical protein